jgi:hypothetical protein
MIWVQGSAFRVFFLNATGGRIVTVQRLPTKLVIDKQMAALIRRTYSRPEVSGWYGKNF